MSKCTSKSKRTGKRCNANAMTGREVCYHHGGKTPTGIASPQFKTGRYSQHLPSRLLSTYEESRNDPDLLALVDATAILDARLVELIKRIDTGESGAAWSALRKMFAAYQESLLADDDGTAQDCIRVIGELIAKGLADSAAWSEITANLEQRRKLVESERKRLVEMQQMVSVDQAALMVRALVASVRQHVHDPAILRAISDDLARLAVAGAD